jgi:hypothetical protein
VSDSAFRVWRILGGGKIRQTLCVLFLAKILKLVLSETKDKNSFFIAAAKNFLKGV